jgi:2,5-furandicarboxylate decarboxylase 1
MALGVTTDRLNDQFQTALKNPVKPKMVTKATVQEVVIKHNIDICHTIPVLTYHKNDAGPYMTSAFTVAKDPDTSIRGMGVHRIQVKGKDTVGIYLANPPLTHFLVRAKQQDRPLEVAIIIGADPLTFLASIVSAPKDIDKFDIAGGLAKTPVELVKCETVDLEVPASAQFVLEGHITSQHCEKEGPFGEESGYYITAISPVVKITAITHRTRPVYHALVPASGEGRALISLLREPSIPEIQQSLPCVQKLHFRSSGIVIAQIRKSTQQDVTDTIDCVLNRQFARLVIVIDEDVDITDPAKVDWALGTRVRFDRDVVIKKDLPGKSIIPSNTKSERDTDLARLVSRASKMGIDATKPLDDLKKYEKVDFPEPVKEKVASMMRGLFSD